MHYLFANEVQYSCLKALMFKSTCLLWFGPQVMRSEVSHNLRNQIGERMLTLPTPCILESCIKIKVN